MKAFFISDIHLKDSDEPSSQILLGFLFQLEKSLSSGEPATHLFLVGDIFDLWISSHPFFVKKFQKIVDQLKKLKKLGLEIHYFEGNHDLYLKDFWELSVGMKVHPRADVFQLGSFRVRVEHGDLINPEDKGYLFLYRLLRTWPLPWLAKTLPSSIVKFIGTRASGASREYTSMAKSLREEKIRELIKHHVLRVKDQQFDFIVSGHVHVRDDQTFEFEGRRVRSINLGAWFDHAECFIFSDQGARFARLNANGEWSKGAV